MSKMVVDKDLGKSVDERLDMLHQYFQRAQREGTIQDSKRMLNEAERLELKTKAPLLLADVLFTEDLVAQVKQNRNLLLRFCIKDKKVNFGEFFRYGLRNNLLVLLELYGFLVKIFGIF